MIHARQVHRGSLVYLTFKSTQHLGRTLYAALYFKSDPLKLYMDCRVFCKTRQSIHLFFHALTCMHLPVSCIQVRA